MVCVSRGERNTAIRRDLKGKPPSSSKRNHKWYNCAYYIGKSSNNKEVYMPSYEYVCKDCNHGFTAFLSIKEFEAKPIIKCPQCQSDNVQKKLSEFTAKTSKKS
jgi:putative FmdB family regulatory protein